MIHLSYGNLHTICTAYTIYYIIFTEQDMKQAYKSTSSLSAENDKKCTEHTEGRSLSHCSAGSPCLAFIHNACSPLIHSKL